MPKLRQIYRHLSFCIAIILVFSFLLSACSMKPTDELVSDNNYPKAEIVFQVTIPKPIDKDSKMILEVLDDVTGLYFNSSRFDMAKKDDLNYFIRIPMIISSEAKYRYIRSDVNSQVEYEYTSEGQQVRYRIAKISGPDIVQDTIAAWISEPYAGNAGRVMGQVIDKKSNTPVPNVMVNTGGMQTITSSDGSFIIEGLVPGVHNFILYSMDGAYETFQQQAAVADGATTPVQVYMEKRKQKDVTFTVTVPDEADKSMPLRFVSNLHSLGNAYADLSTGSSGSAVNFPEMEMISENEYSIKLPLPEGLYLRYKFSYGDGFWNSELDGSGNFVIRDLIVKENQTIKSKVASFSSGGIKPVNIYVQTPPSTPLGEKVFIQFNPFGWMEPLPMVQDGANSWHFILQGPLHLLSEISINFCRNGLCGISDAKVNGNSLIMGTTEQQTVSLDISNWKDLSAGATGFSLKTEGNKILPKPEFIAGIELTPYYLPSWKSSINMGLVASAQLGGDWVILSPTWSIASDYPPLLKPVPGVNLLWDELQDQVSRVVASNQKPIFYPKFTYTNSIEIFWSETDLNDAWWLSWKDRYAKYLLNNADLAEAMSVPAIVIGDPAVMPSMDGGNITGFKGQLTAIDGDKYWRDLIALIRTRYKGQIIGIATINNEVDWAPSWLDSVDMVYVLFSPGLEKIDPSSMDTMIKSFDQILEKRVKPISDELGKKIILGVSFPSNEISLTGNTSLLSTGEVTPVQAVNMNVNLDLQARLYNSAIISAASREWISGFVSRGYNPYVSNQDASSSIYGKPASNVLWFWYHYLLNKAP